MYWTLLTGGGEEGAVGAGRAAGHAAEDTAHVALVVEAGVERHLAQRDVGGGECCDGAPDAVGLRGG